MVTLISEEFTNQPYMVLLPLALILGIGKAFSLLMGKLKIPEVVGYLLGGLAVGLFYFIPADHQFILTPYSGNAINSIAKIGVVLILFEAGIETDLLSIKKQGKSSLIITSLGVIFPLVLGFVGALCFRVGAKMDESFYGAMVQSHQNPIYSDIYYGVILTATSVSITVATLKELG
ncbi:MAG TPA: hypothetical protein DD377_02870, partial [Firmicutes bacterium]|nr:hypothetical protein [Bacillota bacterium]